MSFNTSIPIPHLLTLRRIAEEEIFELTPYNESKFILTWVEDLVELGFLEPLSYKGRPAVRITAQGTLALTDFTGVTVASNMAAHELIPRREGPTIISFSPTSGLVGSTLVITGTNFTGATLVSVNSGAVASFTVMSATQISVTLNNSQTSGKVRVTTPGGTAVSYSSFTVTPTPTLALNIIGVGDSIETYPTDNSSFVPGQYAAARIDTPAGATYVKLGYPGQDINWALSDANKPALLAAKDPAKRNILFFEFGANDLNMHPKQFVLDSFASAAAWALANGFAEVMFTPTMNRTDSYGFTREPDGTVSYFFNDYRLWLNAQVRANAAAWGVRVAPETSSPDMYADNYPADTTLCYDQVHPTDKGRRHLGEGTIAEGLALFGGITLKAKTPDTVVTPPTTYYTMAQGDSITYGNVVNHPWPYYLNQNPAATAYAPFVNLAYGGKRTDMAEGEITSTVNTLNAVPAGQYLGKLLVYFLGVNDLRPTDYVGLPQGVIRTAQQIADSSFAYFEAAAATGTQVLVVSIPPDRQKSPTGTAPDATEDARREQVRTDANNLIAAAAASHAHGIGAFLDLRNDSTVGAFDTPITQAGTNYNNDLLHPSDAGEIYLAGKILAAANALLGLAAPAPSVVDVAFTSLSEATATGGHIQTVGDTSALFAAYGESTKKIMPPASGTYWGNVLITLNGVSDQLVGVTAQVSGYNAHTYTGPGLKAYVSNTGLVRVFENGANVFEDATQGYANTEQFRGKIYTNRVEWFRSRDNFATAYHTSTRTDGGAPLVVVANLNGTSAAPSGSTVQFENCLLASVATPAYTTETGAWHNASNGATVDSGNASLVSTQATSFAAVAHGTKSIGVPTSSTDAANPNFLWGYATFRVTNLVDKVFGLRGPGQSSPQTYPNQDYGIYANVSGTLNAHQHSASATQTGGGTSVGDTLRLNVYGNRVEVIRTAANNLLVYSFTRDEAGALTPTLNGSGDSTTPCQLELLEISANNLVTSAY